MSLRASLLVTYFFHWVLSTDKVNALHLMWEPGEACIVWIPTGDLSSACVWFYIEAGYGRCAFGCYNTRHLVSRLFYHMVTSAAVYIHWSWWRVHPSSLLCTVCYFKRCIFGLFYYFMFGYQQTVLAALTYLAVQISVDIDLFLYLYNVHEFFVELEI